MALNKNKQDENEKIFEPIHIKEDEDDELDGLELDLEEDLEIDEDEDHLEIDEDKDEGYHEIIERKNSTNSDEPSWRLLHSKYQAQIDAQNKLIYNLQNQIVHLQKKISSELITELLENNNKLTSYIHEIIHQEITNFNNSNIRQEDPDNFLRIIKDISHKIHKSFNNDSLASSITKIVHQSLSDFNYNAIITETIQKEMNLLKEQLLLSQKDIIANFMKNIMDDTISEHFQDRSSVTYQKIRTIIKALIDKNFIEINK